MPPIVKENEISTAKVESGQRSSPAANSPGDSAVKQQPVALEVPVSVNGARALEGSDKREPFSESTKTVLIFGNGAVIRLSSSVAPGQLLFLTNEKTKKEVVCQVVKSKNYRSVSGYVELEFTEPVVGFWGMRFPGDRIGSAQQSVTPAPVTPISSVASIPPAPARPVAAAPPLPQVPVALKPADLLVEKPVAPAAPLSSKLATSFDPEAPLKVPSEPPVSAVPVVPAAPVAAAPEFPMSSVPDTSATPGSVLFDSPRVSEAKASFLEPAKTPGAPATPSMPNLLSLFESKQAELSVVPPPPPPAPEIDAETEAIKQHTARLEEQLSTIRFSGEDSAPSKVSVQLPPEAPVEIKTVLDESAAKILQMSQIYNPEPEPAETVEPVRLSTTPAKSALEDEELKIPSWLEPLARNAAAPSSTEDLIEREKAKRLAEQPKAEEAAAKIFTPVEASTMPELPLPTFSAALPFDAPRSSYEGRPKSSSKFMTIGAIAAGILVIAGGGWWYTQQRPAAASDGSSPVQSAEASVVAPPVASASSQPQSNAAPLKESRAQTNSPALTIASEKSSAASKGLNVVPAAESVAIRNTQPNSNPANGSKSAATPASAQPAPEQPKKPVLGELHLGAPKLSASKRAQNGGEPDAGIALTNDSIPEAGSEGLNSGLISGSNQPSAPVAVLPVGGDVKPARLISSTPPAYPTLAKNQHVSGNVQIDALIDASGRVTTMKIVSGPTLLHQAAMDSLKQWKYQPASLDGKPVPMHLTVTIQFRLQ